MPRSSIIEKYWYAFDWNVEAVWALDLPVESFPMRKLEWHLDVPVWPFEGEGYVLTPRDVLKSPYRYAEEYRRMQRASLVFPIDVVWFRGRWLILDGVHRLLKSHEQGLEEIMARRVPRRLLGI